MLGKKILYGHDVPSHAIVRFAMLKSAITLAPGFPQTEPVRVLGRYIGECAWTGQTDNLQPQAAAG